MSFPSQTTYLKLESLYVPGRPLVILAGWLGCRPRSLTRYSAFYKQLGWNVMVKISTPRMVVFAASATPTSVTGDDLILLNDETKILKRRTKLRSLTDLAIDTLQEVMASRCSLFVVHMFSNGGCFLWEKIRQILYTSPSERTLKSQNYNKGREVKTSFKDQLKQKLIGLIFDSSPAAYSDRPDLLQNAMQFSPLLEKLSLQLRLSSRNLVFGEGKELALRRQRAMDFWNGMRNCPSNLPQLYIYSKDDELTPYEQLQELVDSRQAELGEETIYALKFKSSPHCRHFLIHGEEYRMALQFFLERCCNGSIGIEGLKIKSRL